MSRLISLLNLERKDILRVMRKTGYFRKKGVSTSWSDLNLVLRPPENELYRFGGETFVGYKDGSVHYQDAFGRTTGDHSHLKKKPPSGKVGPNELCPCGSGRKYKKCCRDILAVERPSFTESSVRERNLIFMNIICDILGLSQGKTWDDVRTNLSNEQVRRIHEAFGSLWPIDTDIYSLLPVPNKKISRAIYSGIVDPRVITKFATSLTLYFDEIIILNPFINPVGVKPEFSPVDAPHKFKHETLKNVFLMLQLMPFLEAGYINLIPDPCVFNAHLREEAMNMAKKRLGDIVIDESDVEDIRELMFADAKRILFSRSESGQREIIQQQSPSISEVELIKVLQHLKNERLEDPLALLQEDVLLNGGQLMPINLTPNFELGLLIAQLTGSIIITDHKYRWKEIESAILNSNEAESEDWSKLARAIKNIDFLMSTNPSFVFELRRAGGLNGVRRTFREVKAAMENEAGHGDDPLAMEQLYYQMQREHKASLHQWETFRDAHTRKEHGPARGAFKAKFTCRVPVGGLTTNGVQRLLIASGSTKHRHSVGWAICAKPLKNQTME